MEIIEIKVMRGPNYWSGYQKKLIVMKLDIGDWEQKLTNTTEGFSEELEQLLPSLKNRQCSEGVKDSFLELVKTGTLMSHVVEHIALELQSLAGMELGY